MIVDDRTWDRPRDLRPALPWVARGWYVRVARHRGAASSGWCVQKFYCYSVCNRMHVGGSAADDFKGTRRHRLVPFEWVARILGHMMDNSWA